MPAKRTLPWDRKAVRLRIAKPRKVFQRLEGMMRLYAELRDLYYTEKREASRLRGEYHREMIYVEELNKKLSCQSLDLSASLEKLRSTESILLAASEIVEEHKNAPTP